MKTRPRPKSPVRGMRPQQAVLFVPLFAGLLASTGCFGLLLVGGAGTSAIAFATGELRSTEPTALHELDAACASAVDVLGYDEVETEREADRIRWRARTASGDPVDIRLLARGPESTELRIRIGVFGDEAKSRLVLEQVHQSLGQALGQEASGPESL